jgi:hypothetical protein
VSHELEMEGIEKFQDPYDELIETLEAKRSRLVST